MRKLGQKEIILTALFAGLGVVLLVQYKKLAPDSSTPGETARAAVQQVSTGTLPPIVPVVLDQTHRVSIRKNSRNLQLFEVSERGLRGDARGGRPSGWPRKRPSTGVYRWRPRQAGRPARSAAGDQSAPAGAAGHPLPVHRKDGRAPRTHCDPRRCRERDVYTVREGEVIADKFKVQKIESTR